MAAKKEEYRQIYFIGNEEYVKIGIANNPKKRLRALQGANHTYLHIIYTMPGNETLERLLHIIFKDYRIRGEWFTYSGALKKFIECFKDNGFFISSKNLDKIPADFDGLDLEINEDHDKIVHFLKFVEISEAPYHSMNDPWGTDINSIVSQMAMEYAFSQQKTIKLLEECYLLELVYKPSLNNFRVIMDLDEHYKFKEHVKSGNDRYSEHYGK